MLDYTKGIGQLSKSQLAKIINQSRLVINFVWVNFLAS
jgi:hypothetical protein